MPSEAQTWPSGGMVRPAGSCMRFHDRVNDLNRFWQQRSGLSRPEVGKTMFLSDVSGFLRPIKASSQKFSSRIIQQRRRFYKDSPWAQCTIQEAVLLKQTAEGDRCGTVGASGLGNCFLNEAAASLVNSPNQSAFNAQPFSFNEDSWPSSSFPHCVCA